MSAKEDASYRVYRMRALYHDIAHCSLCFNDARPDQAARSLRAAADKLLAGVEVAIMDTARLASLIPTEWESNSERDLASAIRVAIVNNDYSALRAWGKS